MFGAGFQGRILAGTMSFGGRPGDVRWRLGETVVKPRAVAVGVAFDEDLVVSVPLAKLEYSLGQIGTWRAL
jgi:hypothetical protein